LRGQKAEADSRSCNATEIAFLDNPFVRFIRTFYSVLVVIALGWQEPHDFIDIVCAASAERSGRKTHRLTDFELMVLHRALHYGQRASFAPHFDLGSL
jgi:hypothetical protein